ncbi:MAG: RNA polymerase factor sigma-54 [Clostridia bacterium]|nr:RNA polymerase factor sigma-54 [Clostridia bacterium]
MDFNFDLNLVQTQKLLLTPQLKQALEILKMTSQELFEFVEEELEKNPVLEVLENAEDSENGFTADALDEQEWEDYDDYKGTSEQQDAGIYTEYNGVNMERRSIKLTLKEHLMFQLHTSEIEKEQLLIGEYLIDNIDENGYLEMELSEAAACFNVSVSKVGRVLGLIQTFDPPGIGARNLKECLLIQLRQINCRDDAVIEIVENHLDELASNKIHQVSKITKLDVQRVKEAFDYIKTLEPKPGRSFGNNEEIKYIIPDVIVKKVNGSFEVIVNDDAIPLIGINSYYRRVMDQNLNAEARKFLQSKFDCAQWLIKCIEQRRNTLRKVAESILKRQIEFFERGRQHIRPLTMKEIAGEIGMHESTISRTVNSKYLQCTWGIFEMRYFFSGRISAVSGEAVASRSIKDQLIEIIRKEDKKNPLNDSEIAEIFNTKGLNISRRTVAKYRAEMDIPAVSKRKRF